MIVVGSGMGGGVLASTLADRGANVLVLEAGSYLFPTHVGNLPRQHPVGQFDKNTWHLWRDFGVTNYTNAPGTQFKGAQGFNLGGRSIFWGGLIPQQTGWQLADWPAPIREHLLAEGYAAAEKHLNSAEPPTGGYQTRAAESLDQTIAGFHGIEAPMAVQYIAPAHWMITAGLFSTADLLLEDALRLGAPRPIRQLTVNLNHAVWRVLIEGGKASGVRCYDLLERTERTYRATNVVLAAGTIESAKIALQSGLKGPTGLVGRGITDHTVRYRHFTLPPNTLAREPFDSAKVLLQHPAATPDQHAFDIVVELGTELNQGRYVNPTDLEQDENIRNGWTMCEIVFQYHTPLLEQNYIETVGDNPATPVLLRMDPAIPQQALLDEADHIAQHVFDTYGAQPVLGEGGWPALQTADLGGVAHEVGTLRLAANGEDGVLDSDLRFLDVENLYACDNSVFPVSPAANPSLTLVALALRLAQHL